VTDDSSEILVFLKCEYTQHNMMYFFSLTAAIIAYICSSPNSKPTEAIEYSISNISDCTACGASHFV
jgi:hypothetical protein